MGSLLFQDQPHGLNLLGKRLLLLLECRLILLQGLLGLAQAGELLIDCGELCLHLGSLGIDLAHFCGPLALNNLLLLVQVHGLGIEGALPGLEGRCVLFVFGLLLGVRFLRHLELLLDPRLQLCDSLLPLLEVLLLVFERLDLLLHCLVDLCDLLLGARDL